MDLRFMVNLHLCELTDDDADDLFEILSDYESSHFTVQKLHDNVAQTRMFVERLCVNSKFFAIKNKDYKTIGFIGIKLQDDHSTGRLSYQLAKEYWGQNIMPAAIELITDYCFHNTSLERIQATIKPENKSSSHCIEKAGYSLEKVIDKYVSSAKSDHSRIRLLYVKQKI